MSTAALIEVPYKLQFDRTGRANSFEPGDGSAGWTTRHVEAMRLRSFLRNLPPCAWMPGTVRLAHAHGLADEAPPMRTTFRSEVGA